VSEISKTKLKFCPLCGGDPVILENGDFQMGSVHKAEGDTVEWYFYSGRAIQCSNCNLMFPDLDYPNHRDELARCWNERGK